MSDNSESKIYKTTHKFYLLAVKLFNQYIQRIVKEIVRN